MRVPKVLVVDSNESARAILHTQLNDLGCLSQEVGDTATALTVLRAAARAGNPFRIALIDSKMPVLDSHATNGHAATGEYKDSHPTGSLGLAKHIVADSDLHSIALVLMTSLGHETDIAALQEAGFAGTLSKPVWRFSLQEALTMALQKPDNPETSSTSIIPSISAAVASSKIQSARILVVEDILTNQKVALAILSKLGYQADLVGSGEAALAAIRKTDYDLVLMDCENAKYGRLRNYTSHAQRRFGNPSFLHPHHCRDCQRNAGRPRKVPRSENGRLSGQTSGAPTAGGNDPEMAPATRHDPFNGCGGQLCGASA